MICNAPEEFDAALDKAAGAEVIGVVGGDGSVSAAAEKAFANNLTLAVIPAITWPLGISTADHDLH